MLGIVQSLEPAGVGARNLGECIALQLRQLDPETPARDMAIRVALEHLDLVASQQLALLRRQLRCNEGDLEMALALVRSCHPRPGAAVNPAQARVRDPRCIRAPHRARLDGRNQPSHRAAGARQSELRQLDIARARSRDAAHPAAGSALADAQLGDSQRDIDQGGALHRAAPDRAFSKSARRRWSR